MHVHQLGIIGNCNVKDVINALISNVHAGSRQEAKLKAFQQLRPVCAQLLQLKNDPQLLSKELMNLQNVLSSVDKEGLQACKDYVLFPLFILLDAGIACRGGACHPDTHVSPFSCFTS